MTFNQGVNTLGQPTARFWCFLRKCQLNQETKSTDDHQQKTFFKECLAWPGLFQQFRFVFLPFSSVFDMENSGVTGKSRNTVMQ
jgi:hypothetical protein